MSREPVIGPARAQRQHRATLDPPGSRLPGPLFFAFTFCRLLVRETWGARWSILLITLFMFGMIVLVSALPFGYKAGRCYHAEQVGPIPLDAMVSLHEIPCP